MRKYADNAIAKREKVFEIYEKGLKGFCLAHREELESNPGSRELNGETFRQYLQKWHDAVPDRHKPFVERIADLYGIEITNLCTTNLKDR